MINRWVERDGLKDTLKELGIGSIAFTPLAQGMLTAKYLKGIPEGSRATQGKSLRREFLNDRAIANIRKLNEIAEARGQTLAQMAIAWVLRDGGITSALIGASRPSQVEDCVGAVRTSTSPPTSSPRSTATPTRRTSTSGQGPPRQGDARAASVARGSFFVYENRCESSGTNRNASPTSTSTDWTSPT